MPLVGHTLVVVGAVTDIHDTAQNTLGKHAFDKLGNEFIYLKGCASIVATDFVTYDEAFLCTRLLAGQVGPVAVAMAAVVAAKYGWFQIGGSVSGNTATVADDSRVFATPTAGRVDDQGGPGEQISGAMTRSANTSNVATIELSQPWIGRAGNDQVEIVTATNVITADETGKVFFLDTAGGFVSTLPAVAVGLHFTFIVKTAPTTSYTVVCASGTLIKGHVLTNDVNAATDADFGISGEGTLTFVLSKAVAGDRAEFWCDGVNWHVEAACSVFDAITIS